METQQDSTTQDQTAETRFITAPMVNVNDETATLTLWTRPDKTLVQKGEVIAVLETAKATFDLEAEDGGYLHIFTPQGVPVRVGEVIGALAETEDARPQPPAGGSPAGTQSTQSAGSGAARKLTKKAELAALKAGLDPAWLAAHIPGEGPITEADVTAAAAAGPASRNGHTAPAASSPSAAAVDTVDDVYPRNRQQRLLVIGGGYGAAVLLATLARMNGQRAVAILDDDPALAGKQIMGIPILGGQNEIEPLRDKHAFDAAIVAVSTSNAFRERMHEKLSKLGIPLANVFDPTAIVQLNASFGVGNVVLAYCHIGACATIGDGNFFSPYVDIEHHSVVGDFCSFGPGVMTSALVRIGSRVKFGTGIFIEPRLEIGPDSIVGSGAILTRSIPPRSVVKTKTNYLIRPRE